MEIKPVVEKLRSERINSSIEQLKSLLCLEKADILEMTVSFLTRLQQQKKIHFASQNHVKSPQQSHCTELHNQRHNEIYYNKFLNSPPDFIFNIFRYYYYVTRGTTKCTLYHFALVS
uniref:BHLH domain-containing protein n=1 Tax=Neogobius melanostomus TaxID=47308 RepID=A0A8C6WHC5_9GOBI